MVFAAACAVLLLLLVAQTALLATVGDSLSRPVLRAALERQLRAHAGCTRPRRPRRLTASWSAPLDSAIVQVAGFHSAAVPHSRRVRLPPTAPPRRRTRIHCE